MHRMGQHPISTVASRISWILSPHFSERLKNPFKPRSGEHGGTKVLLASADRGFEG